ncbi:MAG: hypothetical protein ACREQ5_19810, partial [Candidatus Dormibacteria bacterium]
RGTRGDAMSTAASLPYDLVLVEWVDASRLAEGWLDLDAIPAPYPHRCVTVGFVVGRNDHALIVLPTIGDVDHEPNRHGYGGMMIPKSAVLAETRLELAR